MVYDSRKKVYQFYSQFNLENMKFLISYYFDGEGTVEIEADSEGEAKEKFQSGEFENEEESGDQYNIESIEKV